MPRSVAVAADTGTDDADVSDDGSSAASLLPCEQAAAESVARGTAMAWFKKRVQTRLCEIFLEKHLRHEGFTGRSLSARMAHFRRQKDGLEEHFQFDGAEAYFSDLPDIMALGYYRHFLWGVWHLLSAPARFQFQQWFQQLAPDIESRPTDYYPEA
eukprot:s2458_g3.t1